MNRLLSCSVAMLANCWLAFLASSSVSAETVVINYTDRGWYTEVGTHLPEIVNYIVGDTRYSNCSDCKSDYRNFFVFDLAGVTQPIASAKLVLSLSRPLSYYSVDPSENYELHDIITPISSLVDGSGGVAAHTDLGSGVVYGSRTMTAADNESVVEITLNSSAIAALEVATGLIGIGGSLTTLDDLPNVEQTSSASNSKDVSQLRLTLVPEPSTLLLLAIGAISLLGYRRRDS